MTGTELPIDSSGPLGILLGIAFLVYMTIREVRRLREVDLDKAQKKLAGEQLRHTADLTAQQHRHEDQLKAERERYAELQQTYSEDVAALKKDLADVKREVEALRDENFSNAREASLEREGLIRENAGLRALLAEHQIDTEGVSG